MFNVSALLLDDAFKPATTLTNMAQLTKRCDSLPYSVLVLTVVHSLCIRAANIIRIAFSPSVWHKILTITNSFAK